MSDWSYLRALVAPRRGADRSKLGCLAPRGHTRAGALIKFGIRADSYLAGGSVSDTYCNFAGCWDSPGHICVRTRLRPQQEYLGC